MTNALKAKLLLAALTVDRLVNYLETANNYWSPTKQRPTSEENNWMPLWAERKSFMVWNFLLHGHSHTLMPFSVNFLFSYSFSPRKFPIALEHSSPSSFLSLHWMHPENLFTGLKPLFSAPSYAVNTVSTVLPDMLSNRRKRETSLTFAKGGTVTQA